MTKEEQRLLALIQRVFAELGGRAENAEVIEAVVAAMDEPARDGMLRTYIGSKVSSALRQKLATGLALAQNINGTWTQLSLMTVDEHRFCVRAHLKLSSSHRRIAKKYADHCYDVHGIDITDELSAAA